jgi:Putative peptidoglycan binding domain/N-acetylmuramoyl-L-alanine amidase
MYELSSPGWFKTLNGMSILHHELPADFMDHGTSWALGRPDGLLFHYQAGRGSDLYDVQIARGYPIIAFNVDQSGQWRQYADVRNPVPWHAYDVSKYFLGVEHAALTQDDFNPKMLENSAKGMAALIQYWDHKTGYRIPVVHALHLELYYKTAHGISGHADIKPGSAENPTGHTDTLGLWSWSQYLNRINFYLAAIKHPAPVYPGHLLMEHSDEVGVLTAKKRLNSLGYKGFTISPHFGSGFTKTVAKFQKDYKLQSDGIIGPQTWRKMWEVHHK